MIRQMPQAAFTVTTRFDQRVRLEEVKAQRARRTGAIPHLKDLVIEALDRFLEAEERTSTSGGQP
jgi:myo-inositol catabolism protein IolC